MSVKVQQASIAEKSLGIWCWTCIGSFWCWVRCVVTADPFDQAEQPLLTVHICHAVLAIVLHEKGLEIISREVFKPRCIG